MEDNFGAFYTPVLKGFEANYESFLPQSMLNELPYTGFYNDQTMTTDNVSTSGAFQPGNSNMSRQTTLKQPFSPHLFSQKNSFAPLFPQTPYPKGLNLFKRTNSSQFRGNTNPFGRSRYIKRNLSNSTLKSSQSNGFHNPIFDTVNYFNSIRSNSLNMNQLNVKEIGYQCSNASTNVSRINSVNEMSRNGVNNSVRNSFKLRPRKSKRNPNIQKGSPLNRAFNKVLTQGFSSISNSGTGNSEKLNFDANDAVKFFEGLVMFVLGILRTIFRELRSDVIMGMFDGEDPDYNAARSYYYSNLEEKFKCSGLTQRIDYTEAIENEYKRKKTVVEFRVEEAPEYVNPHNTDFMNMTEKEFEEFLLKQAFPNNPLSVPRI